MQTIGLERLRTIARECAYKCVYGLLMGKLPLCYVMAVFRRLLHLLIAHADAFEMSAPAPFVDLSEWASLVTRDRITGTKSVDQAIEGRLLDVYVLATDPELPDSDALWRIALLARDLHFGVPYAVGFEAVNLA